jgi:hypothetical protein
MRDEYQRAFKKWGPAKFANKGYVTVHCRINAFAYVIDDQWLFLATVDRYRSGPERGF